MSDGARVETTIGDFVGTATDGVRRFLGVPYAESPTGARRWRPPQELRRHLGVWSADRFGAAAPQLGGGGAALDRIFQPVRGRTAEDCLYLNVWTPGPGGPSRPVLVWLHGGGFLVGAGSTFVYDGASLARRGDAVVVTINYRLGALGFLDLQAVDPAAPPTANLGLCDQLAALAWVRDHIAAFGGDPRRVTLFGESAGAMSIGPLLAAGRDLFRRAILQGGAAANVSDREWAADVARCFLEHAGAWATDTRRLRALSVAEILAAQRRATLDAARRRPLRLPWQPTVDGRLLTERPLKSLRRGDSSVESVIVGTNRDEWRIATGLVPPLGWLNRRALVRRVVRQLGIDPARAARLVRGYERSGDGAELSPHDVWVAVRTDEVFTVPAIELCDALATAGTAVHAYRFDLPIPRLPRLLGACHGAELPLLFGTFDHPFLRPLYGGGERVRSAAHRLQDVWLAFARDGTRGLDSLDPAWPRCRAPRRQTLIFGDGLSVVDDPSARRLEVWRREVDRTDEGDRLCG